MNVFRVGILASILNPRAVLLGVAAAVLVVTVFGYRAWLNTSAECVGCHSDRKKMEELKSAWAYVTNEMVRKESRHPHIECRDCHLGNGKAKDKEKAHKNMLKMLIVSEEGTLLDRGNGYPYGLSKTGGYRLLALLPKVFKDGAWRYMPVRNILWHDRDPATFDFAPRIAGKTCGKSGCHPEMTEQFSASNMGKNYRQRTMRTWLVPYGPHNCGPSFADLPRPEIHKKPAFDYTNTRAIMEEMNVPFNAGQAKDKQKLCNVCHAGCLDCHYTPGFKKDKGIYLKEFSSVRQSGEGTHAFSRVPTAESCSGFGRGNTICHPGAMQSRRGETYIGGDYSVPQGMPPDVHYKKGLGCVECHLPGEGGMGHVERKASCQDCHLKIEEAHSRDVHRAMDCAACHIKELRGYQITAWGPGRVAGKWNPFNKYSLYYGIQSPPILLKDKKGVWMPVKVLPHSLGNVKADVPPSEGIQFRWQDGETRDAYFIIGTFEIKSENEDAPGGIPGKRLNNKHLLWLEIEQAAHPFGPARGCPSCHSSSKQISVSRWEFLDDQGAEPFTGGYRIVADEKNLKISGLEPTSDINILEGYEPADFAPWLYLKDKWTAPGDFSIKTDRSKYGKYHEMSKLVERRVKILDGASGRFDKKRQRRYKDLKGYALHNPEEGLKMLDNIYLEK